MKYHGQGRLLTNAGTVPTGRVGRWENGIAAGVGESLEGTDKYYFGNFKNGKSDGTGVQL